MSLSYVSSCSLKSTKDWRMAAHVLFCLLLLYLLIDVVLCLYCNKSSSVGSANNVIKHHGSSECFTLVFYARIPLVIPSSSTVNPLELPLNSNQTPSTFGRNPLELCKISSPGNQKELDRNSAENFSCNRPNVDHCGFGWRTLSHSENDGRPECGKTRLQFEETCTDLQRDA